MVKLPDQYSLGELPDPYVRVPTPTAGEVNAGSIGAAMQHAGQGVENAGAAVMNYAVQQDKQQNALDIAKADTGYKVDTANLRQQFEENPGDPATLQQRYNEQLAPIQQRWKSTFANPKAAESWEQTRAIPHGTDQSLAMRRYGNGMIQEQKGVDFENSFRQSLTHSEAEPTDANWLDTRHIVDIAKDSGFLKPSVAQKYYDRIGQSMWNVRSGGGGAIPQSNTPGAPGPAGPDAATPAVEASGEPSADGTTPDQAAQGNNLGAPPSAPAGQPRAQPVSIGAAQPTQSTVDYLTPYAGKSDVKDLNPDFRQRLQTALSAMPENLRSTIKIDSGYRDSQEQHDILVRWLRERGEPITQANLERGIPGKVAGLNFNADGSYTSRSQHASGAAVDIKGSPEAMAWLHQDGFGKQYGFENPANLRGSDPVHFQMTGNAPQQQGATQPINVSPTDRDMMIRTVIGEAGDQGQDGESAVAHVILNRLRTGFGGAKSATDVVKAPGQFEPWQTRSRGLMAIQESDPEYQQAAQAVDAVLSGQTPDNTNGATHFYGQQTQAAMGRNAPSWASQFAKTAQVGEHAFYQDPKYAQALQAAPQVMSDASYAGAPRGAASPDGPAIDMSKEPKWLTDNYSAFQIQQMERQRLANMAKVDDSVREQAKSKISNDIATIERTGQIPVDANGRSTLGAIAPMFAGTHAKEYEDIKYRWERAILSHALNDSSVELGHHMLDSPATISEAKFDPAVVNELRGQMAKIEEARSKDIAAASDSSHEVQAAHAGIQQVQQLNGEMGATPQTRQQYNASIVKARLAAQQRWDILPGQQSGITKDEARGLLGGLTNINDSVSSTEFNKRVAEGAVKAEQMYGKELAPQVMQWALAYEIKKGSGFNRQSAARVALAAIDGRPPDPADVQALHDAQKLEPLATLVDRLNPRSDTSLPLPAVAASLPYPKPNPQQVEALQQNPGGWQDFVSKFGADAAVKTLAPGVKPGRKDMQGKPTTPGLPTPAMPAADKSQPQGWFESPAAYPWPLPNVQTGTQPWGPRNSPSTNTPLAIEESK